MVNSTGWFGATCLCFSLHSGDSACGEREEVLVNITEDAAMPDNEELIIYF